MAKLFLELIALGVVITFGVDKIVDKIKMLFGDKNKGKLAERTHNEKIEDGFKLIEYLAHLQDQKMKDQKIKSIKKRENVA
jgi:hypothetical protein